MSESSELEKHSGSPPQEALMCTPTKEAHHER